MTLAFIRLPIISFPVLLWARSRLRLPPQEMWERDYFTKAKFVKFNFSQTVRKNRNALPCSRALLNRKTDQNCHEIRVSQSRCGKTRVTYSSGKWLWFGAWVFEQVALVFWPITDERLWSMSLITECSNKIRPAVPYKPVSNLYRTNFTMILQTVKRNTFWFGEKYENYYQKPCKMLGLSASLSRFLEYHLLRFYRWFLPLSHFLFHFSPGWIQ